MTNTQNTQLKYERITAEDVQVGDKIARTRNDEFGKVEAINEGQAARRFALTRTTDKHWTPTSYNPNPSVTPAGSDMGNIRPRRTAKLWRIVEAREPQTDLPASATDDEGRMVGVKTVELASAVLDAVEPDIKETDAEYRERVYQEALAQVKQDKADNDPAIQETERFNAFLEELDAHLGGNDNVMFEGFPSHGAEKCRISLTFEDAQKLLEQAKAVSA